MACQPLKFVLIGEVYLMRDTLIFPPNYELQFLSELNQCQLIQTNDAYCWDDKLFRKYHQRKQKIYQMVLLFENIVLLGADDSLDYGRLESLGHFMPIYDKDYHAEIEKLNLVDCKQEFAIYLKPAILPALVNSIEPYYIIRDPRISLYRFTSALYDYFFNIETGSLVRSSRFTEVLEKNMELFSQKAVPSGCGEEAEDMLTVLNDVVAFEFENLSLQLDICDCQNATMLNSVYQLDRIGCAELDFQNHLTSYALLKVECQSLITEMPRFTSILDIIKFKEKHRHDVFRLRQQIDELEYVLRTQSRVDAIKKAATDIRKANDELTKSAEFKDKVDVWTTYLPIPISIAEIMFSLPPIAGISLSLVGLTSSIINSTVKRKNNWIHVLRY